MCTFHGVDHKIEQWNHTFKQSDAMIEEWINECKFHM